MSVPLALDSPLPSVLYHLVQEGLEGLSWYLEDYQLMGTAFNPLVWLAQFLCRQRPLMAAERVPRVVGDARVLAYLEYFQEDEYRRGRRLLLSQKPEILRMFELMAEEGLLAAHQFPDFLRRLDEEFQVEGQLRESGLIAWEGLKGDQPSLMDASHFWEVFLQVCRVSPGLIGGIPLRKGLGLRRALQEERQQVETAQAQRRQVEEGRALKTQRIYQAFKRLKSACVDLDAVRLIAEGQAVLTHQWQHPQNLSREGSHVEALLGLVHLFRGRPLGTQRWDAEVDRLWKDCESYLGLARTGILDQQGLAVLLDFDQFLRGRRGFRQAYRLRETQWLSMDQEVLEVGRRVTENLERLTSEEEFSDHGEEEPADREGL